MMSKTTKTELLSQLTTMKNTHIMTGPASAELRKDRLLRAAKLITENHKAINETLNHDFGHRSDYQSLSVDILTTLTMLRHAAEQVHEWMKPEHVKAPLPGMQAWIEQQPLGVVGIISPWNFPINLAFGPLAGVFAAGNTAMLKPSELTPQTSELLANLIPQYFLPDELQVVLGDADVGQAFSALPFDHLIFTGSTTVGKHVMRAAAENLVPVTLELGGKSPVFIDKDADMALAMARTLTIKTFNAGQICLSPDYLLVPQDKVHGLVDTARIFMSQSFPTVQTNPDYTAIISPRHFDRLVMLLNDARQKGATVISLAPEGEADFDTTTRKISPHLVLNVSDDMLIMQEEIFGPLLPVKTFSKSSEALSWINAHPRPLAAYYFGNDRVNQANFIANTTSGAVVINDVMTHAAIESLPFGGIGPSGMGAYHGVHGFRRFSHQKPVVVQNAEGESNLRLRAPYQDKTAAILAYLRS